MCQTIHTFQNEYVVGVCQPSKLCTHVTCLQTVVTVTVPIVLDIFYLLSHAIYVSDVPPDECYTT